MLECCKSYLRQRFDSVNVGGHLYYFLSSVCVLVQHRELHLRRDRDVVRRPVPIRFDRVGVVLTRALRLSTTHITSIRERRA